MSENYVASVTRTNGVPTRVACRFGGAEVVFARGLDGPRVVSRVCYFDRESMNLPKRVWDGMRRQVSAIFKGRPENVRPSQPVQPAQPRQLMLSGCV